jgi:hypothetical protein
MAKAGQRKCLSCGEFFIPDHRKGERQRYCCAANCRLASMAASQAAWLARPPNVDYFSGPVHVARVQAWRAAHPGYSRGRVRPSRALQDLLPPQVPGGICLNYAPNRHRMPTSHHQGQRKTALLAPSGRPARTRRCWTALPARLRHRCAVRIPTSASMSSSMARITSLSCRSHQICRGTCMCDR